jgi:hypothetical protein
MSTAIESPPAARMELVRWATRLGAVTAEALAERQRVSVASARARLLACERAGLLSRWRPLTGQPALYTPTRAGLRAAGAGGQRPCQITPANATHAIASAGVAVVLERAYPGHEVIGERELRAEEQECSRALASAVLGTGADGRALLHRPDLVLRGRGDGEWLAVEVELTVKAPRRLLAICRAWARSRCVAGVLYVAAPAVERPLQRAIEAAEGEGRIAVLALAALAGLGPDPEAESASEQGPSRRTIPVEP